MSLGDFQRHIGALYLEKDRRRGEERTLLWLIEEVGEMTEAARRGERARLAEEMADVLAWTASLANLHGIDLDEAVRAKYPERCARCDARPCACAEAPAARL